MARNKGMVGVRPGGVWDLGPASSSLCLVCSFPSSLPVGPCLRSLRAHSLPRKTPPLAGAAPALSGRAWPLCKHVHISLLAFLFLSPVSY